MVRSAQGPGEEADLRGPFELPYVYVERKLCTQVLIKVKAWICQPLTRPDTNLFLCLFLPPSTQTPTAVHRHAATPSPSPLPSPASHQPSTLKHHHQYHHCFAAFTKNDYLRQIWNSTPRNSFGHRCRMVRCELRSLIKSSLPQRLFVASNIGQGPNAHKLKPERQIRPLYVTPTAVSSSSTLFFFHLPHHHLLLCFTLMTVVVTVLR
ncbi:hypothetical protein PIB30_039800 [Stylosanthes scabra]|uniref:Uncharacterized protein n=1 Tax=Stylosanthes scabra TaxID=79078 RepID=A0ABU6YGE5_9FABA|nr:hypothetical protein [Stylosanthes scabra]